MLHFSHCPSHLGIHFNEEADHLATNFVSLSSSPNILLRQHFLNDESKKATRHWQALSLFLSYRGKSWMKVKHNKKPFTPHIKNKDTKHFFMEMAGDSMREMS